MEFTFSSCPSRLTIWQEQPRWMSTFAVRGLGVTRQLTCVGTVSASLAAGRQPTQSALSAAVAGSADRKLLMGPLAADIAASSPVMLTMAPRRCSSAVLWQRSNQRRTQSVRSAGI